MTKQASKKKFQPGDVVILKGFEKSRISEHRLGQKFTITKVGRVDIFGRIQASNENMDGWMLHPNEIELDPIHLSPLGQALR